jgi:orotate phosphoribosyltransferase
MKVLLADPTFAHQRGRLLELLTRDSYQEREVVLSSGKKSNFYIDCKQTTLQSEGHFLVGQLFQRIIDEVAPEAEAVGGLTLGADPLASAVAVVSFIAGRPRHAFIVRKEPKGHGTGQWIEGTRALRPGMPVVILEDVVTTGASTLSAVERARTGELQVVRVVALVDRDEGGREAVEAHLPLTALYTRHDFRR